ncbi:MAG: helical backbone metal receptor [Myxococcota bacterium]|nr:helical backbone metal receptor [Myxococcota bacterium]
MPARYLLILAAFTFALVSCGAEKASSRDGELRIVSLAPSLTDILSQLEASSDLVGISRFCKKGPTSQAKVVGSMIDAQSEELVALSPTHLLFVGPQLQFADVSRLSPSTRLEHFEMSSLEDVRQAILRLSVMTERLSQGQDMVARLNRDIEAARAALVHGQRPRVMFLLDSAQHGRLVAGPGTYLDDIITAIGLTNAGADVPGQNPWRSVDAETALAARPDLLLIKPDGEDQAMAQRARDHWLRFAGQPGITLRDVQVVTGWEWTVPSATLGAVALTLGKLAAGPSGTKP